MEPTLFDEDDLEEGPPPCQEPDCSADSVSETDYSYCEDHAEIEESGDDEPEIAEVTLSDSDFGGNDLFAGIEAAEEIHDEPGDEPLAALDGASGKMEGAINDGAARLAVLGLDDVDGLESEFQDVFEAFRLGYFGSAFFEEYILVGDDDDLNPAWGLLGSSACCLAVVLWMRPDGEDQILRFREAVSRLGGGSE